MPGGGINNVPGLSAVTSSLLTHTTTTSRTNNYGLHVICSSCQRFSVETTTTLARSDRGKSVIQERLQLGVVSFFRQRFVRSIKDMEHRQRNNLLRLIKANSDTWFGQHHQFAKLHSIDDYRSAVPLCRYPDVAKLVDRITAGEQHVLTSQPVTYLQTTSGTTTGNQKLFPSTVQYRKSVWLSLLASQGFLRQWLKEHQTLHGRGLMLSSTSPTGKTDSGIPYGFVTAGHAVTARHLWNWISNVPFAVTQIKDAETRRYLHWRFALEMEQMSFIGTTYPLPLLVFATMLYHSSERLIRDIANGTLDPGLALSNEQRQALEERLQPQPARATQLDILAQQEGGLRPRFVWPDLNWLYTVHGPVYQLYEAQLKDWYGQEFIWGMPYIAAEGIIGIPFEADSYRHLPTIDVSFLEFIAETSWGKDQPQTCLIRELQIGTRYEVVLSGWNGLYRYRLGDVVEPDVNVHDVPTLRVVSRRGGMLSIVSEKMTETMIVSAVIRCEQALQILFRDFIVDIDNTVIPARYRLWGELESTQANVTQIHTELDNSLCSINVIYSMLRNDREIGSPIVKLVPSGTFERYRLYRETGGSPPEQIKILHSMSQCPDFLKVFS